MVRVLFYFQYLEIYHYRTRTICLKILRYLFLRQSLVREQTMWENASGGALLHKIFANIFTKWSFIFLAVFDWIFPKRPDSRWWILDPRERVLVQKLKTANYFLSKQGKNAKRKSKQSGNLIVIRDMPSWLADDLTSCEKCLGTMGFLHELTSICKIFFYI